MDYTKAVEELRQMIADTSQTKRVTRKQMANGTADGNNTLFYTWDKRVFEDSFQLFVDNELQDERSYELTNPISGEVTFDEAPDKDSEIRASYYFQWWIDDEIKNFLNKGAELTGEVDPNISATHPDQAYLSIQPGLKNAALKFAGHLAMDALVSRFVANKHSAEFLLEQDGNVEIGYSELIKNLQSQANTWFKQAVQLRDDFYKRQGRRNAPAFGIKQVNTKIYGPIR
jgi:hypothetical protein